jgi:uncharacterized protein YqfA (UPF0365 family)
MLVAISDVAVYAIGIVAAILGLVALIVILNFGSLWIRARAARTEISFVELIGMWLRRVNSNVIVNTKIQAWKAGLTDISTDDLETHYLSRGRIPNVIVALISAQRANIPLDFRTACAIDLAGRDIVDAVNTSVNPKVIDCPGGAGTERLDAVAKDGIRLLAKGRVTVRTNIQQLVGGATEETVIARVGQAIVSAIGSCDTYKAVLENPDKIAKRALDSGLASGTAFSILSIDIADISVAGVSHEANVGAKLQAEQADADKRRFQAEAEKRRALAMAREQEMRALVVENRAKVVLAEAEIPKAMAEAFRNGNFGIMDYYRTKNIQADTGMRGRIGDDSGDSGTPDDSQT